MIHTFQLVVPIRYEEVALLQRKSQMQYKKINDYLHPSFPSMSFNVYPGVGSGEWYLSIQVDVMALLEKGTIEDNDLGKVEYEIQSTLRRILGHSIHYKDHRLTQIDYCYNIVMPENERKLLLHLYKSTKEKYRYQHRYLGYVKHGKYTPYETTVYNSSKQIKCICYDKPEERRNKGENINSYEEDILRFEVSLQKKHLKDKNNRTKYSNPTTPKLENYFRKKKMNEYFQKYMKPIYMEGDYYSYKKIKVIIYQSDYNKTMKEKLKQFVLDIAKGDASTPLRKGMSRGAYRGRVKYLNLLGINPVSIPKNHHLTQDCLKSPLSSLFDS